MSNIAWPDLVTVVSTTEDHKLGSTRTETAQEVTASDASLSGAREWIYVKASVALVAGDVVEMHPVATAFNGRPCTTAGALPISLLGVASHAIALNSYGWIVRRGEVAVKSAGVSAGNALAVNGSAQGIPVVANADATTDTVAQAFGRALTATSGGLSDAYVSFP